MATDTFTLSDTEHASNVTLDDVHAARIRGYVFDDGRMFMAESVGGPALAGAAARMALGGPVAFSHLANGCPVYVLAGA